MSKDGLRENFGNEEVVKLPEAVKTVLDMVGLGEWPVAGSIVASDDVVNRDLGVLILSDDGSHVFLRESGGRIVSNFDPDVFELRYEEAYRLSSRCRSSVVSGSIESTGDACRDVLDAEPEKFSKKVSLRSNLKELVEGEKFFVMLDGRGNMHCKVDRIYQEDDVWKVAIVDLDGNKLVTRLFLNPKANGYTVEVNFGSREYFLGLQSSL